MFPNAMIETGENTEDFASSGSRLEMAVARAHGRETWGNEQEWYGYT